MFRISKAVYQNPSSLLSEVLSEAFLSLRTDIIQSAMSEGRGYVETSPQGTFLASAIARAIPSARFLHMVRHPADVIRSGMRRGWYGGISSDSTRIVPRGGTDFAIQWSDMTQFQKIAWLWSETNRWIMEFSKTLPIGRTLLFRAEDLFSGKEGELQKLFAFSGSHLPIRTHLDKAFARKLNTQQTGVFPEAKDWTPAMRTDLHRIAGTTAAQLGYVL
ncbi:MAG: hypothetical protein A3J24_05060 [Deltaproteobacteria bacterium RIFCSPLOWO2_02_FULL_53_8]|nr:MAG: hypothetical protein A3J24_05060 [Deltaproteobacteria bacterium RIFCSPLOWO2_02_FULL_53_8]